MTIVQLFGEEIPTVDAVRAGFLDGYTFYIAEVAGIGRCPHHHRKLEQGQRCVRMMRAWEDDQASRREVALLAEQGLVAVIRHRPGPRRRRRPW